MRSASGIMGALLTARLEAQGIALHAQVVRVVGVAAAHRHLGGLQPVACGQDGRRGGGGQQALS
jgi:hypothetical protein